MYLVRQTFLQMIGWGGGEGDEVGGGGDFWSQRATEMDLFMDCVVESTLRGLEGCEERLERRRVPILSDFGLEERVEGGECCR